MLALLYDVHHQGYLEDLQFWKYLAAEYKGPILELGCGTGRVLLALLKEGHDIYGLDCDLEMLELLREKSGCLQPKLRLIQADFRAFCFVKTFVLIILPCNTYSTLTFEERKALLERVSANLKPGGVFAVSMPNPIQLRALPPVSDAEVEELATHPISGNPIQISTSWEREDEILHLNWHYDHLLPDGNIERYTTSVDHHLIDLEKDQSAILETQLRLKAVYGDFELSPFSRSSPYCILLIEKPLNRDS